MQNLGSGDSGGPAARLDVERRLLVRVLPVAQKRSALQRQAEHGREGVRRVEPGEVVGDRQVVGGDAGECLRRQPLARRVAELAALRPQLLDDRSVLLRVGDDRHVLIILGRGPHQGRPADVDVLNDLLVAGPRLGDRCLEWIEVAHDEINRADAELGQGRQMLRAVAAGEDAAVDVRVERLDPAVEDFRKARQVGDVTDGQPRVRQRLTRTAGGNQLHPQLREGLGERHHPDLLTDA